MTKDQATELLARIDAALECHNKHRRSSPMDDDFRKLLEDADWALDALARFRKGLEA